MDFPKIARMEQQERAEETQYELAAWEGFAKAALNALIRKYGDGDISSTCETARRIANVMANNWSQYRKYLIEEEIGNENERAAITIAKSVHPKPSDQPEIKRQ